MTLLGLNAKRALESPTDDDDYDDNNDNETIDSSSSRPSRKRGFKRRRATCYSKVTVKVEAIDNNSLLKDD